MLEKLLPKVHSYPTACLSYDLPASPYLPHCLGLICQGGKRVPRLLLSLYGLSADHTPLPQPPPGTLNEEHEPGEEGDGLIDSTPGAKSAPSYRTALLTTGEVYQWGGKWSPTALSCEGLDWMMCGGVEFVEAAVALVAKACSGWEEGAVVVVDSLSIVCHAYGVRVAHLLLRRLVGLSCLSTTLPLLHSDSHDAAELAQFLRWADFACCLTRGTASVASYDGFGQESLAAFVPEPPQLPDVKADACSVLLVRRPLAQRKASPLPDTPQPGKVAGATGSRRLMSYTDYWMEDRNWKGGLPKLKAVDWRSSPSHPTAHNDNGESAGEVVAQLAAAVGSSKSGGNTVLQAIAEAQCLEGISFNLGSSEQETKARENVVLPYSNQAAQSEAKLAGSRGGVIYVDTAEELDEDLDDDLDF